MLTLGDHRGSHDRLLVSEWPVFVRSRRLTKMTKRMRLSTKKTLHGLDEKFLAIRLGNDDRARRNVVNVRSDRT